MDAETTKLIKDQYAKLPPALQQAIQSTNLHDQIAKIGTKNQLHIDQIGLLEDEVTMLMMGFTDPLEFASTLQEHVHVDAASAQKISTDVNQEILLPIRDALEGKTTEVEAPREVAKPAAVSTPPTMPEKSVVMPSSIAAAPKPVVPTPVAPLDMQINAPAFKQETNAPVVIPAAPIAPKPAVSTPSTPASAPEVDVMFNEPTVSMPKKVDAPTTLNNATKVEPPTSTTGQTKTPPAPAPLYKADPYREPIE